MSNGHQHAAPTTHRTRLAIAFAITLTILVAEVIGAIWTNSLALLVDAGHMLTDATGLLIALIAASLALRRPTPERTWGYRRAEVLAAGAQAAVLLGVGVYAFVEGVRRLFDPPEVAATGLLVFGVVGLVGNVVSMLVLSSGRGANLNMRAAFLEVVNDALGSVAVIISAVVIALTGWTTIDALAGMLIAALIVPRAVTILREAGSILLESTPPGLDLDEVRRHLLDVPHVQGVHDLHASTIASGLPVLTAHVVLWSPAASRTATPPGCSATSKTAWPPTSTSASNTPPSNSNRPTTPNTNTPPTPDRRRTLSRPAGPRCPGRPDRSGCEVPFGVVGEAELAGAGRASGVAGAAARANTEVVVLGAESRAGLEWVRDDFDRLVSNANPRLLDAPTSGTRWTNRELLFHMWLGQRIGQRSSRSSAGSPASPRACLGPDPHGRPQALRLDQLRRQRRRRSGRAAGHRPRMDAPRPLRDAPLGRPLLPGGPSPRNERPPELGPPLPAMDEPSRPARLDAKHYRHHRAQLSLEPPT